MKSFVWSAGADGLIKVSFPRAPSYLNSRLLGYGGYVTLGYIEPSSFYLGNWRVFYSKTVRVHAPK